MNEDAVIIAAPAAAESASPMMVLIVAVTIAIGFVIWLGGARLLKPALALAAAIIGGTVTLLATDGLKSEIPWEAVAGIAAVVSAIAALVAWRFAVAILAAKLIGTAAALCATAVFVWPDRRETPAITPSDGANNAITIAIDGNDRAPGETPTAMDRSRGLLDDVTGFVRSLLKSAGATEEDGPEKAGAARGDGDVDNGGREILPGVDLDDLGDFGELGLESLISGDGEREGDDDGATPPGENSITDMLGMKPGQSPDVRGMGMSVLRRLGLDPTPGAIEAAANDPQSVVGQWFAEAPETERPRIGRIMLGGAAIGLLAALIMPGIAGYLVTGLAGVAVMAIGAEAGMTLLAPSGEVPRVSALLAGPLWAGLALAGALIQWRFRPDPADLGNGSPGGKASRRRRRVGRRVAQSNADAGGTPA